MLPLPIGIENYQEAVNKYYVDKTLLIRDIVEYNFSTSILITRPRRFGKSLALSMLETYFSDEVDGDKYFKDKKIVTEWNQYQEYLNKYPVIHLNMKNVEPDNIDYLYDMIRLEVSKLYNHFLPRFDNTLNKEELETVQTLAGQYAPLPLLMNSIELLSRYLYKVTGKKVVLLIDEYDTPIQNACYKSFYQEAIGFFKPFYTSALKGNDALTLAVVTGVMQISKESLFSGLNNLKVYSILDNRLSSYFGFTEKEVIEMLNYYHIKEDINKIRDYYGGYLFGNTHLFNPWSILNFVDNEAKYRFYWKNSGTNRFLIDANNNEAILEIYNEPFINATINNSISYNDINDSRNAYLSFLLQCGYLSVLEESDTELYKIYKPNLETVDAFKTEIINRYFGGNQTSLPNQLKDSLLAKDNKSIQEIFEKYILSSFSYFDYKNEKNYQILTLGIVSILFENSIVKSETNTKYGRADIMISPKKPDDIGLILEIKYSNTILSNARLEALSKNGLSQIKKNKYFDELKQRSARPILLYSFAYDGEHLNIQSEEI